MAFLDLLKSLPGPPIGFGVLKKEFQISTCGWRVIFHDEDDITACPLHQAPKLVIALGRIRRQDAPFAQHLSQHGLESTHLIVFHSNGTLVQDNPGLHFIDMQDMLLRFLPSIHLVAGAFQRFAVNRQMNMPVAWMSC